MLYCTPHTTYNSGSDIRVTPLPRIDESPDISLPGMGHSSFRRLGESAKLSQQVFLLNRRLCYSLAIVVLVLICGKETNRGKRQGQGGVEAGGRMAVRCVLEHAACWVSVRASGARPQPGQDGAQLSSAGAGAAPIGATASAGSSSPPSSS